MRCPSCANETSAYVNEVAVFVDASEGGTPPYLTRFECLCGTTYYEPPELAGRVEDSAIPKTPPMYWLMKPKPGPGYTLPVITRAGMPVSDLVGRWERLDPPTELRRARPDITLPTIYSWVARPKKRGLFRRRSR